MTTVRPETVSAAPPSRPTRHLFASIRHTLDRPLASYYLILASATLLLTIGLIMVLSSSSVYSYKTYGDSYYLVRRQLIWAAIGLPVAWLAATISPRWIRRLAWPGYLVSIALLMLTAVVGHASHGNQNWLAVGPVVIQPAEIAKLALVVWAAHIYANKDRRLGRLHEVLVPVVPGLLLAAGLVVAGRDLGTGLVLFAILLGMLWVVGVPGRVFGFGFSLIAVVTMYLATTSEERLARITTFADPFRDFEGTGWQPAHGLYALASGHWFGEGLGHSRQKWGVFPGAHTDFIFAVLGEELGFVGAMLVIGLFLTLAFAALRVAMHTADPFTRYATFGIVVWLVGQMIINVGMVLTLLPVIGLPLPLVSYGGSALVPTLAAIGLLIGFARREPEAARALAARKRPRSTGLAAGRVGPPAI